MTASSSTHQWFKSSYSGGSGTECFECALADDSALVRDSKNTEKSVITIGGDAWRFFLQHMREARHQHPIGHSPQPPRTSRSVALADH
ncbi:DUF397 domain-containing protein [Streptomyces sp. NPDC000987]|uniref:DUF397 domain-containing protein n=1 Tax=Streptomyces sp. NPDC000987 TaxID=3154374 RepID=UPI003328E9D2